MSEFDEIERDLFEYFKKEPNLRKEDRMAYLTTIFHKHMELEKLDHVINHYDYFNILSEAKKFYTKMRLPICISKKELVPNETTHVATIETFIRYLNRNNLLKKFVKFDFTE